MSEQQAAPRRSRLEAALEQAGDAYNRLVATTRACQTAKTLVADLTARPDLPVPDLGHLLVLGDIQVPLPLPADTEQRAAMLEDAVDTLSNEVVRLWTVLFQAASLGKGICDEAVANAQAQAQPAGT